MICCLAAATAWLAGTDSLAAQAQQAPVVVVSFSGYDEVLADVAHVGKLAGNEALGTMLEAALARGLQGGGLAGLDKKRPWGAVVQTDGAGFSWYVFVPVSDLGALLNALTPRLGKPTEASPGVWKLEPKPGQAIFVRQKGTGWAVGAPSAEVLQAVADDPLPALADLPKTYDLAVRVNIRNTPAAVREQFLFLFRMILSQRAVRREGETEQQFRLRDRMTRQSLQRLVTLANELDWVQVGLNIDRQASRGWLEYQLVGAEGTATAEELHLEKEPKTDFAGFVIPGATLSLSASSAYSQTQIRRAEDQLDGLRQRALAELKRQGLPVPVLRQGTQIINELADIMKATIAQGRVDMGLSLMTGQNGIALVAGTRVAEAEKVDKLFRGLARQAVKDGLASEDAIQLDSHRHGGVSFHTIRLSLPADVPPQVRRLTGDPLNVVLGAGQQAAYLAVGPKAVELLNQAMDRSRAEAGKPTLPMTVVVAVGPLAQLVTTVGQAPANQMVQTLADMLSRSEGKDHLTITTRSIPHGSSVRIEFEEDLLKVLGALPTLAAGMVPPGP